MKEVDLLVIGGGSAGLAAAVSAFDEGIEDIMLLERNHDLGGILNQCIHNGFGLGRFHEELTGPEFAERYIEEARSRGILCLCDSYVNEVSPDHVVSYSNEKGFYKVRAKAIIFAAGSLERSAGAIALPGDRPSGVMTAGTAQMLLNFYGYLPGKNVFILGSGDIGLIMARRLSLEGAKVLGVAELCPYSNGLNRNIVQCLEDFDIPLYLSHTVSKVIGKRRLEAIELSKVDEKMRIIEGSEERIACDTLILSVGLLPNVALLSDIGVSMGANKGAAVDERYMTSVPGVFACGNALHIHDLADNVVSEAQKAAHYAAAYLKEGATKEGLRLKAIAGEGLGYLLPSYLSFVSDDDKIDFKFRVRRPYKRIDVVFKQGEKEVKRLTKPFALPSEMEIISLPVSLFDPKGDDISVHIEEKEARK